MKFLPKVWTSLTEFAQRNEITLEAARDFVFGHNECDWSVNPVESVRWNPDAPQKPQYKKISKSDQ